MTEGAPARRRLGPRTMLALRDRGERGTPRAGRIEGLRRRRRDPRPAPRPDDRPARGAVLTALVGVVLSAWRWQRVLLLFDVRVRIPALFSHYVVGLLVGNVLPSTIGGDVVRVARASNTVGSSEVSFGSVVLERLTGFVALPLARLRGLRDPTVVARPRPRLDRVAHRGRDARVARGDRRARRPPAPRGTFRRTGELGPVHRRGAPGRRADAPRTRD